MLQTAVNSTVHSQSELELTLVQESNDASTCVTAEHFLPTLMHYKGGFLLLKCLFQSHLKDYLITFRKHLQEKAAKAPLDSLMVS